MMNVVIIRIYHQINDGGCGSIESYCSLFNLLDDQIMFSSCADHKSIWKLMTTNDNDYIDEDEVI